MKRFRKSAIALVLALLMALQGTEPIFVQAKEAIEDVLSIPIKMSTFFGNSEHPFPEK